MTTALRRLSDLRMTDAPEVGGKAASLGELVAAGVQVPDGVVLTVAGAQLTSDERRALLERGAGELGAGTFAVRSSGISEDGAERSFAGMYESALDVPVAGLAEAADRTLASADGHHFGSYAAAGDGTDAGVAVIVQRMVHAVAAGVALTADPITGDRETTVVTAVRGTGDRLVSGASIGDEWVVSRGSAIARRRSESAIDDRQAMAVATEAGRIATERNRPQDVEWAMDRDGTLWILQARPMTALPPQVSWAPGAAGAYTRQLRLGEWIGAPVTPLFATWLLPAIEDRMHSLFKEMLGQRAPRPYHVIVNGWYFYSINFLSGAALLRSLPGIISHAVREPRAVGGVFPATVRHSFPVMERAWRNDVQPRYRALVAGEEARVETLSIEALPCGDREIGRCRRRVLHLDRGPERGGVQAGDQSGPLLPGSSQGRAWAAATCRLLPASRLRPRPAVTRSVADGATHHSATDGAPRRRPRITCRWCGSGRLQRQRPRPSWPGHLAGSASSGSCDRQPAPRHDPGGADGRGDAALAGHAARRGADRSGPGRQRCADRSGRRVLHDAGRGCGRAGPSIGVHDTRYCRPPCHSRGTFEARATAAHRPGEPDAEAHVGQLSTHVGGGAVGVRACDRQPGLRRDRNGFGPRRPRSG